MEQLVALIQGGTPPEPKPVPEGEIAALPILVMHSACPFTAPAEELWRAAAATAGHELVVVLAQSDEGDRVVSAMDVRGVPCLLAPGGRRHYGLMTPEEAAAFLQS